MRLMYDGINNAADVNAIRATNPAMVAYYIDGLYNWTQAEIDSMPASCVKVAIAVKASTNAGDVIDCENGDATPDDAANWVRMRKASGYSRPTIYCSRSGIPAVRTATGTLVLGRDYDIWCADWTGVIHQVTSTGPGVTVALPVTQFRSGVNYDTSVVYDNAWPHRTNPVPAPVTIPVIHNPIPVPVPAKYADDIVSVKGSLDITFKDGSSKTFAISL